jgi:hypothetical protein
MAIQLHKRKFYEETCNLTTNQSTIGSLMYAMIATRSDITFAIGGVKWYNQDSSNEQMVGVKRVLRYLNDMKDWHLHFGGEATLRCCVDSDYPACPDGKQLPSAPVITFRGAEDW